MVHRPQFCSDWTDNQCQSFPIRRGSFSYTGYHMGITQSKDNCRNVKFFRPNCRTKSLSQIQRPQTYSDWSGGFTHRLPMQWRSYGSSDRPGASCAQKLLAENLVFWYLAKIGKGKCTGRNRIPIGPAYLPIDSSYIECGNEAWTGLEHHVCRSY